MDNQFRKDNLTIEALTNLGTIDKAKELDLR